MKVEDLMLGDWVQVEGTPLRVGGLSNYDIYVDLFRGNESEVYSQIWADELDSIQPIPITPEILEKSFEKKIFYGMYDDFFDLEIREYYEGVYAVTYHYCEFPQADQIVLVSLIHELQHTLRLLNIKKEIVL